MNKWIGICLCVAAFVLTACDSEDHLTPSGVNKNYFAVSVSDTVGNPTNALRYRFFNDHQIYLFFNDTIRREARGTYADGTTDWFVEMLDVDFSIENTGYDYNYGYITDLEEQKKCVSILENYILPHIGERGGRLCPYSFLLVKELKRTGYKKSYVYNIGTRCTALNFGAILEQEDEKEIAAYCKEEICYQIIYDILDDLGSQDTDLDEFAAFCSPYYNKTYTTVEINGKPLTKKPDKETFLQLGFLDGGEESGSKKFCYKSDDWEVYLDALFFWEEEEPFEVVYEKYGIILKKYTLLKNLIEQTYGYKFK